MRHYSASGRPDRADKVARQELGARISSRGDPGRRKAAIFDQLTQRHIDFMLSKFKGRFVLVELAAMVAWLAEDCAFSTGAVFDISGGRAAIAGSS